MDDNGIFNSSDIEFDEPPPNPFSGVGKASIDAIIAHAVEDRIESKKISKQLTFVKGRPGTQYRNMLWYQRFQSFREHSLRVSAKDNPTGEQIERFMTSIVARVSPKVLSVPSYEWLKGGLRHLLLALIFHHAEFNLNRHASTRISTSIQQLLKDGRLTRDPSREKQWVGAFVLRKIATAILHNALHEGTLCWDVTLSRIASVVLTAALSARAGDVARDPLDDQPLPYLCFKDITIKFVDGLEIENLVAHVIIRNEKSKKDNPHHNRTCILNCLKDGANNVLCPVQFLLIVALRSGNTGGADSIEEALQVTRARSSKTIVWTHPERPVICSFQARGVALLPEKAANRTQISKTLAEGGLVAGVIASLASHDIRYGAARDTANLPGKIKGIATPAVAATLGHSMKSHEKGITAKYVGSMSTDTWTSRVEEDFQDPFGPQINETAPRHTKKRRFSGAEVTKLCQEQGLDPFDKKQRARASYADKQTKKREWIAATSAQSHEPIGATDSMSSESTFPSAAGGFTTPPSAISDDSDAIHEATNLERVLTACPDAVMTDTVEEAIFDQLVNAQPDAASEYSQLEFLKKFSTINISSNQSLSRPERQTKGVLDRITGNGRDELTFFKIACENAAHGCKYTHHLRYSIVVHESSCRKGAENSAST